jgi:hypothetical protein
MPLASWVDRFQVEAKLIGSILTGYGELEFWMATCVATSLNDTATAFRTIFRLRNESQRIDVADALLYPVMKKHGLSGAYSHAVGAMRHCRTIRNQYSHCHWEPVTGAKRLSFFNLEAAAFTSNDDSPAVKTFDVDVPLLTEQVSYFEYCLDGYCYLVEQLKRLAGEEPRDCPTPKPKARKPPKLHIQQG